MITNEKQYKITNAQAEQFGEALKQFEHAASELEKIQKDALQSQLDELKRNLTQYEQLRSGEIKVSTAKSIEELPEILIKARISQRLTQAELAERLGLKAQQIQRYEAEMYATASFTRLKQVSDALGIKLQSGAQFLLNASNDDFWADFPIKEMYERGWFVGFAGSSKEAKANAEELITDLLCNAGLQKAVGALHRKNIRAGSQLNEKALLAWQARIIQRSFFNPLPAEFTLTTLNAEWFKNLVQLSAHNKGPLLAREYLANAGVHLIIEPHLTGTHLDGAAMKGADNAPIVAMTLRYDRTDNFWFVLLHELAHVVLHLYQGQDIEFFDDLSSEEATSAKEREADDLAHEMLLESSIWKRSPARFLATEKAILMQAKALGISEAIIAGRIRRERKDWTSPALQKLVGQNQVRYLFEV